MQIKYQISNLEKEKVSVAILLSTYNGEQYLEEQLDSLIKQNCVDLKIVIRDDGSKDNTIAIIKKFQNNCPFEIILLEGENIGWRKSFFKLIQYAYKNLDSDYFAFCDQDDIWLPDKLRIACKMLDNIVSDKPRLYCSNLYYFKDGKNEGKIRSAHPIFTKKNSLIRNYATGCTVVFDKKLLMILAENRPNITIAHDYWAYLVAVFCGNVYIDDNSYILYRQHDNNQIGSKMGFFEIWNRRFRSIYSIVQSHQKENQARELLRLFSDKIDADGIRTLKKLALYRNSLTARLYLFLDSDYTTNKKSNDFWLKIKILLGVV